MEVESAMEAAPEVGLRDVAYRDFRGYVDEFAAPLRVCCFFVRRAPRSLAAIEAEVNNKDVVIYGKQS